MRNHWPSTLPVTEKAQQEPHMPCKRRAESGLGPFQRPVQPAHPTLASSGSDLVLDIGDSPLIPPVPLRRRNIGDGLGQAHVPARRIFQEGVQVDGAELLLCGQRWAGGGKRVFEASPTQGPWEQALSLPGTVRALATTPTCQVTELGDPILSCATVQGLDLLRSHHVTGKDGHAPTGF